MQSLARSCDNTINEAADEEAVDKTANHAAPLHRCPKANYYSDSLFRGCIEVVELGQLVKVRIDKNLVKYDKIKKRFERAEQSRINCDARQKKDGDMSVPLFEFTGGVARGASRVAKVSDGSGSSLIERNAGKEQRKQSASPHSCQ